MKLTRRVYTYPLRKWRTWGFGVHSPFAFDMMTKVIGNHTPYECYSLLPAAGHPKTRRLRLLIRLLCRFNPASVTYTGSDPDIVATVRAYSAHTVIDTDGTAFVINDATSRTVRISDKGVTVSLGIGTGRYPYSYGMTFTDRRVTVICALRHLPRQNYRFTLR